MPVIRRRRRLLEALFLRRRRRTRVSNAGQDLLLQLEVLLQSGLKISFPSSLVLVLVRKLEPDPPLCVQRRGDGGAVEVMLLLFSFQLLLLMFSLPHHLPEHFPHATAAQVLFVVVPHPRGVGESQTLPSY
jgi:hypothetical protein